MGVSADKSRYPNGLKWVDDVDSLIWSTLPNVDRAGYRVFMSSLSNDIVFDKSCIYEFDGTNWNKVYVEIGTAVYVKLCISVYIFKGEFWEECLSITEFNSNFTKLSHLLDIYPGVDKKLVQILDEYYGR